MTLVILGLVRVVPRVAARIGDMRLLAAGLALATIGATWLSQVDAGTAFLPGIGVPLMLMGFGMGSAFTPLTSAGIADVGDGDAGAASGLVNAAHQLGGAIGISVMVTVFAGAGGADGSAHSLAGAIGAPLAGSAVSLALALAIAVGVMWRPSMRDLTEPAAVR
jgi:hypothetical protein